MGTSAQAKTLGSGKRIDDAKAQMKAQMSGQSLLHRLLHGHYRPRVQLLPMWWSNVGGMTDPCGTG